MKAKKLGAALCAVMMCLSLGLFAACGGVSAESVSLNKSTLGLKIGETGTIVADVEPSDSTDSVRWSVTKGGEAISIAADGDIVTVTAKAAGNATVTATAGGKTASCDVVVSADINITLSEESVRILWDETATITATVSPASMTDAVSWTVDDADIVSIQPNGGSVTVRGERIGSATVTAYIGDESASCEVAVTQMTQEMTLSDDEFEIPEGESKTVTVTLYPEGTASPVNWWIEEGDDIVSIAANGTSATVTAKAIGEATIAIRSGSVEQHCYVTVVENVPRVPATGITLDKTEVELPWGAALPLTATVEPADATDKVVWSVSKGGEDIVWVTPWGDSGREATIYGNSPGTATVTATAGDVSASCVVTVPYTEFELTTWPFKLWTITIDWIDGVTDENKQATVEAVTSSGLLGDDPTVNADNVLQKFAAALKEKTGDVFGSLAFNDDGTCEYLEGYQCSYTRDGNHITILIDLIEQENFAPVTVEADIDPLSLILKWPTRMFGLDYALVTMEYR